MGQELKNRYLKGENYADLIKVLMIIYMISLKETPPLRAVKALPVQESD